MLTGRPELIQQAVALLPVSTRLDTLNPQGHTALMLAAVHNDETTLIVSAYKQFIYVNRLVESCSNKHPGNS